MHRDILDTNFTQDLIWQRTTSMKEILIADDDKDQVFLLHASLRRHGIKTPIRHFDNGKQLIDYLLFKTSNKKRRIILLDLSMPVMNGIEALRKIKSDDKLKRLPIIVWTTTNIDEIVEECYDLGCNAFITKPINPEMFEKCQQVLGDFIRILSIPRQSDNQ